MKSVTPFSPYIWPQAYYWYFNHNIFDPSKISWLCQATYSQCIHAIFIFYAFIWSDVMIRLWHILWAHINAPRYIDLFGDKISSDTYSHISLAGTIMFQIKMIIYSASGKYSQRFTFSTFCYVYSLIPKLLLFFKILHTIPHNDTVKNIFFFFLQIY